MQYRNHWIAGAAALVVTGCNSGNTQNASASSDAVEFPINAPVPDRPDARQGASARSASSKTTKKIGTQCTFSADATGLGEQHLALLIGVNDYAAYGVSSLPGTEKDIETFSSLLMDPAGQFQVAAENICILQNDDASLENTLLAFNQFLLRRVDAQDRVTIYYSGHGSQIDDPDGASDNFKDETLFLQNSGAPVLVDGRIAGATPHLTDDVVGGLIRRISLKLNPSQNPEEHSMLVILDSCNSYSATRGDSATGGDRRARLTIDPLSTERLNDIGVSNYRAIDDYLRDAGLQSIADELVDSGESLASFAPPGAVVISSASDGFSAFEDDQLGQGYFTASLIEEVISSERPLTYEELEVRLLNHPRMKLQTPSMKGNLDATFMGSTKANSGATHRVVVTEGSDIQLSGPPVFGNGAGATFLIFDGDAASVSDLNKAKASVKVVGQNLFPATAELSTGRGVQTGDKAVLFSASPLAKRLTIGITDRIETELSIELTTLISEPGLARSIAIDEDIEHAEILIDMVGGAGVGLVDEKGIVRATFSERPSAVEIASRLEKFAIQKSLKTLRGSGAGVFRDNYTLELEVVPITEGLEHFSSCADGVSSVGPIQKVARNAFVAPVCTRYEFWVKANGLNPNQEIDVGVVSLAGDGQIWAFPDRSSTVWGNPIRLTAEDPQQRIGETWQAAPPSDVSIEMLLFGIDADYPVKWWRLREAYQTRNSSASNAVEAGLIEELTGGTRNVPNVRRSSGVIPWTMTSVRFSTVSNVTADGPVIDLDRPPTAREYTVNGFDIRPYLPSDTSSALYKVLFHAHDLATKSKDFTPTNDAAQPGEDIEAQVGQGYPYKQHDWCAKNDDGTIDYSANLELGIDCSRSIWYAYTMAGLPYATKEPLASRMACQPYGEGSDYLTTRDMAKENARLANAFDSCTGEDLRIGDVLVYRDDTRGDGHTVMVIDPFKRVAWGSHGWDGQSLAGNIADRGVEYQFIKVKKDWQRWDRSTMTLRACWRHKAIAEELSSMSYARSQMLELLCPSDGNCTAPPEPWGEEYLASLSD